MSTEWTRNDSIRLGEIAYQLGLTREDAGKALILGARVYAHGFTGSEIDEMIQWQYRQWADQDWAVQNKTATPDQVRRWWGGRKRND